MHVCIFMECLALLQLAMIGQGDNNRQLDGDDKSDKLSSENDKDAVVINCDSDQEKSEWPDFG